jgi:quercetin dioxygenase-like cupin family protein
VLWPNGGSCPDGSAGSVDHRPGSTLAVEVDPGTVEPGKARGQGVRDVSVGLEHCAAGDRIPLHVHPDDEVMIIAGGRAEVTLGEERYTVGAGAVIFIPAGRPHGLRTVGAEPVYLHEVLSASVIGLRYLEHRHREELGQLRIDIDEEEMREQVAEITGSDFFHSLQVSVRAMRDRYLRSGAPHTGPGAGPACRRARTASSTGDGEATPQRTPPAARPAKELPVV